MSTPRPWTCTCAGRDKKVWQADPTCEVHGEGVAAPLEPSNAEKFYDDVYEGDNACVIWNTPSDKVGEIWRFAEAYAAAVSKNLARIIDPIFDEEARRDWTLKEKLELVVRRDKLNMDRIDELEKSEAELEKEIAALRETK